MNNKLLGQLAMASRQRIGKEVQSPIVVEKFRCPTRGRIGRIHPEKQGLKFT